MTTALAAINREPQVNWMSAQAHLESASRADSSEIEAELALEHGHALIAARRFEVARETLEAAIARCARSPRLGELRYLAGVACFHAGRADLAKQHWCWVCEHLPGDRLFLYTDGVIESRRAQDDGPAGGEQFGLARLEEALRAPGDPIAAVDAALERFRAGRPLEDDVAMLTAEVVP